MIIKMKKGMRMIFRILMILPFFAVLGWGSDPWITLEGFGESYFFSKPHDRSEGVADLSVEPTIHFSDAAALHTVIGFAHPAENGDLYEAELEVLSLDVKLDQDTNVSFGKVHVPVGLYNLYHEPIYFLTIEPSRVEHLIVPAEWHETAALLSRRFGDYSVTAGAISGMDAALLRQGSWIREGKEAHVTGGGKLGWVARMDYGSIEKILLGSSIVSTPLSGSSGNATLIEAHASLRLESGWEGTAIASKGWINDIESVRAAAHERISKNAEGASMTLGYDVGRHFALSPRSVIMFGHAEYARPSEMQSPDGLGGSAWATGFNWYLTKCVVAKAEYRDSNLEGERVGIGIGFVY